MLALIWPCIIDAVAAATATASYIIDSLKQLLNNSMRVFISGI